MRHFSREQDFPLETLLQLGVASDIGQNCFQRDVNAAQKTVFSLINLAHAARAQDARDLESAQHHISIGQSPLLQSMHVP